MKLEKLKKYLRNDIGSKTTDVGYLLTNDQSAIIFNPLNPDVIHFALSDNLKHPPGDENDPTLKFRLLVILAENIHDKKFAEKLMELVNQYIRPPHMKKGKKNDK